MNALLHGVYSSTSSTTFEDRELFNKYMRAAVTEYDPVDDIDWFECKQLAVLMLRRERLINFERFELEKAQADEMAKVTAHNSEENFDFSEASEEQLAIGPALVPMLDLSQVERIVKLDGLLNAQIAKLRKSMDQRRENRALDITPAKD